MSRRKINLNDNWQQAFRALRELILKGLWKSLYPTF